MSKTIALVGASGAVGSEVLDALFEGGYSYSQIVAFAGENSSDSEVAFGDETILVKSLDEEVLKDFDLVVFAAPGPVCERYAPTCLAAGATVIDCSSSDFGQNGCLFAPELNQQQLRDYLESDTAGRGKLIQIPNAVSLALAVTLRPLANLSGVKRVVVSTYQSVSGAGRNGIEELWEQTRSLYNQSELQTKVFPSQIAFNCIPSVGELSDSGDSLEEQKIAQQSAVLLEQPDLRISVTAVQVPVFSCHGLSVNIELDNPLDVDSARSLLRESPGIVVADEPGSAAFPEGVEVTGSAAVHVGRVRKDQSIEAGLNFWIVVDNLKKGAALSVLRALQILSEC